MEQRSLKKVTSLDVARRAGVSQSSVSRAFSNGPTESSVSKKTSERIRKAAKELGYRPNAIARTLITRRSRIIALLFSYLDNPFYALALEKLCLRLQAEGYHALVFMMPDTAAETAQTVENLMDYQVDGIITASVEMSSDLVISCQEQGIPIVMFNRLQDNMEAAGVTTDNVTGARDIARYLMQANHQKIAMLGGWEQASTNRDREFGFRAELHATGCHLHSYARGEFELDKTAEATRKLFDVPGTERPDALFVTNDYMAFRAMSVIRYEFGLSVPQDVSVIGFDDVPRASAPEYSLTTYRQPIKRMVEQAVDMLLQALGQDAAEPQQVSLLGKLIERGSARRPS